MAKTRQRISKDVWQCLVIALSFQRLESWVFGVYQDGSSFWNASKRFVLLAADTAQHFVPKNLWAVFKLSFRLDKMCLLFQFHENKIAVFKQQWRRLESSYTFVNCLAPFLAKFIRNFLLVNDTESCLYWATVVVISNENWTNFLLMIFPAWVLLHCKLILVQ